MGTPRFLNVNAKPSGTPASFRSRRASARDLLMSGQLLQLGRRSRERRPRYLDARHRLHDRDLRQRLRALIAVEREREGAAHPLVVERLLLVVHGGEQDAVPGALLHRDPGA